MNAMPIKFSKYHALKNDFLVIEAKDSPSSPKALARLTRTICERRTGVGADGVLYLSRSTRATRRIDIYNSDGTWAEKSGNGLRIAGVHLYLKGRQGSQRSFAFQTGKSTDEVKVGKKVRGGYMVSVSLGRPEFDTSLVPVKSRRRYMINAPLTIGGIKLPVTCLSVGNPHTVLIVNDFDFDWKTLGAEIEHHKAFPNRTNVEFVRVVSRRKVEVADWERGAGATGSSGTGAAASVCAGVTMGLLDRKGEVVFESGSLFIDWQKNGNNIILTGPVEHITEGVFDYR